MINPIFAHNQGATNQAAYNIPDTAADMRTTFLPEYLSRVGISTIFEINPTNIKMLIIRLA
jgi:hypothetical protein